MKKAKYCKNLQEKYTTFLLQINHARAETLWEDGHFRHPCVFAPVGGLLYSILYLGATHSLHCNKNLFTICPESGLRLGGVTQKSTSLPVPFGLTRSTETRKHGISLRI